MITHDLNVKKIVTGNMADVTKDFTYTITIYDSGENLLSGNITIEKSGTQSTISNGGTFTLKHGEEITVKDIGYGYKYTIQEANNDYTNYYKVEKTTDGTVVVAQTAGTTITKQTMIEDQTVTYTNSKESNPSTFTNTTIKPFAVLLLIIFGILGLSVYVKSMKRHNKKKN